MKTERSCLPFDILNYLKQKETNNVWGKVQSIMGKVGIFVTDCVLARHGKSRNTDVMALIYLWFILYYTSLLVILKVHQIPKKKSRNIVLQD